MPPAHRITSVPDFIGYVLQWNDSGNSPVAFRGQSYWRWKTEPAIFRKSLSISQQEKDIVRELISIHPQEFHHDPTMFDRLVRMQHFGLPTRLLDVTLNPLVALYFASDHHEEDGRAQDGKVQAVFIPRDRQRYFDSDRVSSVANLANLTTSEKQDLSKALVLDRSEFNKSEAVKRLLWFIRLEKSHFEPNLDPEDLKFPVFVKPKMSNRRIIAQSGAFIIFGTRQAGGKESDRDLRVFRAIVPHERKEQIRRELSRLGIHEGTLFPEIEKASSYIVRQFSAST